jgi:CRISPR-associated protein Csx17
MTGLATTGLRLSNCRPEPLGSYLKALGVLRLAGEQLDPSVRGCWTADGFVLTGPGREELLHFLLDRYEPTPLVAPWNSGSGFRAGSKRPAAEQALELVERSTAARLQPYRDAIAAGRRVFADAEQRGWRSSSDKELWAKDTKPLVVERCRATFPDRAVAWIDACGVLSQSGLIPAPLLGIHGTLGSQELSVNFMQRLAEVLCLRRRRGAPTPADSRRWLEAALFAEVAAPRVEGPIGQFDPGGAGGVNAARVGEAKSLVNPWEYVLLLEGALLFASAAARRLGAQQGGAGLPFMVAASPVGYASGTAGEGARGELWAPLWHRPATAREVAHLLGEGRADWRRQQARTGIDLARAAASLGVDRGISAFVRHAFVERLGRSMLAVPVGRVAVRERPEVQVVGALDGWMAAARRGSNPPAAVAAALRRVDAALMALALDGGPRRLQDVLVAAAEADMAVGQAASFRERAGLRPIGGLGAADWLPRLHDGSAELRVAAAIASQHDQDAALRLLLRPVQPDERGRLGWTLGPPVPGLGVAPLPAVLARALARRVLEVAGTARHAQRPGGDAAAPQATPGGQPDVARIGVQTAYRWRLPAPLEDVAAWLDGRLDEARLERLVRALLLLDWRGATGANPLTGSTAIPPLQRPPHPAWALLAPFFHGRPASPPVHHHQAAGPDGQPAAVTLIPQASWPAQLAAGRVEPVVSAALRRLRIARLDPVIRDPAAVAAGVPGERLAAALLCPISSAAAAALLRRVAPDPLA